MNMFSRYGRTLLLSAALMIGMHTAWAQPQQYWTGDGGKGIRLAVLEPVGKGLSADEQWMLSLVQGSITGDFNKYSAMTVIDRQNLEKVLKEWEESMSGNYSDKTIVQIGNLTGASHILNGSISKTASAFMLELSVTDVASGVRRASYSPMPVSPLALENLSAIRAASADLLKQLGVELTGAAQSELRQVVNTARLQAETMLARGIMAQKQGTEVAALSYFYQAAAFDASLVEASKRSSVVAAGISSGNIGADLRNDILWRKKWVATLKETEETIYRMINNNAADPPYTLIYYTKIKMGKVNYQTETADLSITMLMKSNSEWFTALEQALKAADYTTQTVLEGLNATNRKNEWGLAEWPRKGVSNTNPFASIQMAYLTYNYIVTQKKYDIALAFELVNQQGRVIGSTNFRPADIGFVIRRKDGRFTVEHEEYSYTVKFKGVKANDISDNLTIRVASVNGEPPQRARFTITAILAEKHPPFVDTRNGKKYNTVRIGNKVWMAENLNYQPPSGNSWCYENADSNCVKYGRLYDWSTAMGGLPSSTANPSGVQGVCPRGWHLPSRAEWDDLAQAVGGTRNTDNTGGVDWHWAGWALNSTINDNGIDALDFSALPGGFRGVDGSFYATGNEGRWWTATNYSWAEAYGRVMFYNYNNMAETYLDLYFGFSVRCVGDLVDDIEVEPMKKEANVRLEKISTSFTDSRDGRRYRAVKIGSKTWMAENLNHKVGNSLCYGDNEANCKQYGRLYDWKTAKTVCPAGWRLPTRADWGELAIAAGGTGDYGKGGTAGKNLKSTGGWSSSNGIKNADTYGFSALPGGGRSTDGGFDGAGNGGVWWTVTEREDGKAYRRSMYYDKDIVKEGYNDKGLSFSVRCVVGEVVDDWEVEQVKTEAEARPEKISPSFTDSKDSRKEAIAKPEKISTTFTDKRDGKTYRTVRIGGKTWMAENLNIATEGSWCYDNKESNCDKYGRLYRWNTARTACPAGWHLPTRAEWWELAGKKLKSTSGWNNNGNGTGELGFSALPGGLRYTDGNFDYAGSLGGWWTATERGSGRAHGLGMYYSIDNMGEGNSDKGYGYSVRCVAD